MRCVSPWYNRTGWLGVKHQLTYLLTPLSITEIRLRENNTHSAVRLGYSSRPGNITPTIQSMKKNTAPRKTTSR